MSKKENAFIDLGSITTAHKAQKTLESKGIASSVGRRSHTSNSQGCSYGLFIPLSKKDEAVLMLRASFFKIY